MSNPGRHRVLVGFVAASALALIPLAAAGSAWADDEVSGDTGAAITTPVGGGNVGGGANLGLPNPFTAWHPADASAGAGGGAGINTPIGGGDINTGGGANLGTGGAGFNADNGAAVNTPIGGGNIGGGTSFGAGR
ncbi:MAG: hypothetical protein WCE30_11360 [Mycobacterium sp.]